MLEVLVRRHYREYDLHDLRVLDVAGRPFVVADYVLDETGRPGWCPRSGRSRRSATRPVRSPPPSASRSRRAPAGHEAVVDLYLSWPEEHRVAGGDQRPGSASCVGALPFASDVRRIAVAVCPRRRASRSDYFTFRPVSRDGGRRSWTRTTSSAASTRWSAAG